MQYLRFMNLTDSEKEAVRPGTFAVKAWTGPTAVKEVAANLRRAGAQSVSEGTEHVYMTIDAHCIREAVDIANSEWRHNDDRVSWLRWRAV